METSFPPSPNQLNGNLSYEGCSHVEENVQAAVNTLCNNACQLTSQDHLREILDQELQKNVLHVQTAINIVLRRMNQLCRILYADNMMNKDQEEEELNNLFKNPEYFIHCWQFFNAYSILQKKLMKNVHNTPLKEEEKVSNQVNIPKLNSKKIKKTKKPIQEINNIKKMKSFLQSNINSNNHINNNDEKIFFRLNPKSARTQQIMVKLDNYPRLEIKVSVSNNLKNLIEYLNKKWHINIQQCKLLIYPESSQWSTNFQQYKQNEQGSNLQQMPLIEELMVSDIIIAYNNPQNNVIQMYYDIIELKNLTLNTNNSVNKQIQYENTNHINAYRDQKSSNILNFNEQYRISKIEIMPPQSNCGSGGTSSGILPRQEQQLANNVIPEQKSVPSDFTEFYQKAIPKLQGSTIIGNNNNNLSNFNLNNISGNYKTNSNHNNNISLLNFHQNQEINGITNNNNNQSLININNGQQSNFLILNSVQDKRGNEGLNTQQLTNEFALNTKSGSNFFLNNNNNYQNSIISNKDDSKFFNNFKFNENSKSLLLQPFNGKYDVDYYSRKQSSQKNFSKSIAFKDIYKPSEFQSQNIDNNNNIKQSKPMVEMIHQILGNQFASNGNDTFHNLMINDNIKDVNSKINRKKQLQTVQ